LAWIKAILYTSIVLMINQKQINKITFNWEGEICIYVWTTGILLLV